MQLIYFIISVTSQVQSARHHQRAGYSAIQKSSGTSDVAIASVHSEKNCLKKLMKIIIITSNSKTIY